jgi:hypothetical protein
MVEKVKFYEAKRITKEMKECLDALRIMYPKARTYEGVLLSVLLEFEKLFDKTHGKVIIPKNIQDRYSEEREATFGKKIPDSIDWSEKEVIYHG